jgi:type VII secretion integral membrane protein EccD
MTAFSRVTLVSERRRVDTVFPSDEPIGRLMPDMLRLVGDAMEAPPRLRQLITADGDVLPSEQSLQAANVPDGAVLSLVRAEDAPPAPVVHDITEEVADDIELRGWPWGPHARRWTATAATVALMLYAGLLAVAVVEPAAAVSLLAAAAVALSGIGGLLGHRGREPVGTALTLGGGALGLVACWVAADLYDWASWVRWIGVIAVLAATVAFLGVTSSLGRGGITGGGLIFVLGLAWAAGGALGLTPPRLAAVLSVASVLCLGLLPRLALTASGLSALDDRRTTGTPVSRHDVDVALAATHRGLVIATVAAALSAGVAGWLLAQTPNRWTAPLAVLTALILASRGRMFPLVWQVAPLQAAALAALLALLGTWARTGMLGAPIAPLAVAAGMAAFPLAVLALDPPEHVRVRLRRITDRVEATAVIALIPVAIGVFGTYGRLLHVFP